MKPITMNTGLLRNAATLYETARNSADDVMRTLVSALDAFGKLHDLLLFTAVNHENTERSNKTPPETAAPNPAVLSPATAPVFKGAFGGDSDPPFGWESRPSA